MQVITTLSTSQQALPNEHFVDERLAAKKTIDQEVQSVTALQQKSMLRFLEANCDCV